MEVEKIREELKKFNKFRFYEEPHVYTYMDENGNEKEISISVTSLIDEYTNFFDKEKIAEQKAIKEGISKEKLLEKWEKDNKFARIKGTVTHAYNEYLWKNEKYDYDKEEIIREFGSDLIEPVWNKLTKICDSFHDKYKDSLIPIGLEQIIGSVEYDIAGTIDFLAYSKRLDAIIIFDYKTNKEIRKRSFNEEKMVYPLDDIFDSNFYHYSLQLSIYKYILEHETNLEIYPRKWLVWINENNDDFRLYECENLDKEAEKLLNLRKVKA